MTRSPWVTTGPEPHIGTCRRCGAVLPKPGGPVPIGSMTGYMAGFIRAHAGCVEQPVREG